MPTYNAHINRDGETWSIRNFATLDDAAAALRNAGATGTLTRTGTKEHAFIPSGERVFVVSESDTDAPFNLSLDVPVPGDFYGNPRRGSRYHDAKDFSEAQRHVYRRPGTYKIMGDET